MKFSNLLNFRVLTFITVVASYGFSKIHHEHISTVPAYVDYISAFKATGKDLGTMPVQKLSEDPVKSIGEIFGKNIVEDLKIRFGIKTPLTGSAAVGVTPALTPVQISDALLAEKIKPMGFRDLAGYVRVSLNANGHLGATNNKVMQSFFEYTSLNDANRGDWSYMSMGWDFRLYAQDYLMDHKEGIIELFKSFLKRTPVDQRTVVSITANAYHEFSQAENQDIMARIRNEFAKAGSQLEWIGGVTRAQVQKMDPLIEDQHSLFRTNMEKFKQLLLSGHISGMDITGSIVEGSKKYMDLEEKTETVLFERFQIIYDTLSNPEAPGQLKIHMYESTPEGEFYDIFFDSLKDQLAKKGSGGIPPIIRVGHINALRTQDIQRFKELAAIKDRFVFEANIDSNVNLKKTTAAKLAITINEIIANGFKVRLGTDGLGIFGKIALFDSVIERLKVGGLSSEALTHLKSQSDVPIYKNKNYNRFGQKLQCLYFY